LYDGVLREIIKNASGEIYLNVCKYLLQIAQNIHISEKSLVIFNTLIGSHIPSRLHVERKTFRKTIRYLKIN